MARYKGPKYNGWTNYETWNVMLWLDNEEGLYRAYRDVADRQRITAAIAEDIVYELMPNGTPDFKGRGGARNYSHVNWAEIARAMNEN